VVGLFCGAVHIYGGLVGVDGLESNLYIHIYMYMKSSRSVARSMFANMPCRFVGLYIHCNALQHTLQHALQQEYVSKHDMSLCGSAHIHCDIHCNIHCNTRCNTHCNRSMSANMTCRFCGSAHIHGGRFLRTVYIRVGLFCAAVDVQIVDGHE